MSGELQFYEAVCTFGRHSKRRSVMRLTDPGSQFALMASRGTETRGLYWCKRMKRESAKYKRSVGPLLPVLVAEWMWTTLTDFVSGLPRIGRG